MSNGSPLPRVPAPVTQELLIWGSENILECGQGGRGEGWGTAEGSSPTPALLLPGFPPCSRSRHPRGSCLHFRILSLAGSLRGSFLRGQRMESGGGARGFPSAPPRLGWTLSSRSKPSWPAPRPAGSPSPLVQQGRDGYAKQRRVWGRAGFGGLLPCSP